MRHRSCVFRECRRTSRLRQVQRVNHPVDFFGSRLCGTAKDELSKVRDILLNRRGSLIQLFANIHAIHALLRCEKWQRIKAPTQDAICANLNTPRHISLPFKVRAGVGMGLNFMEIDPIPHLASPLKGEEQDKPFRWIRATRLIHPTKKCSAASGGEFNPVRFKPAE